MNISGGRVIGTIDLSSSSAFSVSKATISGGEIYASNPTLDEYSKLIISGGSLTFDPTAYLADGYTATENTSTGFWDVTATVAE